VALRHREDTIAYQEGKGMIDAALLTWRRRARMEATASGFKQGSLEGASYLVSVTYINKQFFDGLPAQYQELLSRAAREASRIERAKTVQLNATSKRRLLSDGMKAQVFSNQQRGAFERALARVYEKTLEPMVGKTLIREIRAAGLETAALPSQAGR
jgi:TRAP-type C4-dicarboxylate transport system substrate-binding protein